MATVNHDAMIAAYDAKDDEGLHYRHTIAEVALRFRVSEATVCSHAKAAGLSRQGKPEQRVEPTTCWLLPFAGDIRLVSRPAGI